MNKYLFYIGLFLIGIQVGQAQPTLIIKKYGSSRNYQFKEGEKLKLRLKSNDEILRGSWQFESEDKIALAGQLVNLRDIHWVSITKKEKGIWILRKGQDLLILVGLGLLTISQVNSILQPDNLAVENQVYVNSARMVAGGLLCRGLDRTLRPRKVRIGHKFKIYLRA